MPGPFEGEPDYVKYIWNEWVMNGDGETYYDDAEVPYDYFEIDAIDIDWMQEAGVKNTAEVEKEPHLIIWADNQGFINAHTFATRQEALDLLSDLGAV
jgi:hypothetical protein